jgi:hypothetical protein
MLAKTTDGTLTTGEMGSKSFNTSHGSGIRGPEMFQDLRWSMVGW